MKHKLIFRKSLLYFFLIVVVILVIIPFYWMIATSFKSEAESLRMPPTLYPHKIIAGNYKEALLLAPFLRYFFNTCTVALFVVGISTTVSVLSAFAFARLEFPGKQMLFFMVLTTMMVPQEMLIITNFSTIARLGWLNTYRALILPFCINAFHIYLLRQNIMQISDELYIAARIDGLSNFRYLLKVVLPQIKSTVVTAMLLSMIWIWNTFAWPNLVTTQDNMRLVSNGLKNAFTINSSIRYDLQMAAATMVTLPLILAFVCTRKYILSGIVRGGVKG